MPPLSTRMVAERLKALLPPDGTPVLNRVLRLMLSRDFGRTVTDEMYEQARDQLFASGQIGRLRGQGGQIFLAKSENGRAPEAGSNDALSESQLMPHLERFLRGPFRKELDIPPRGECLIKDTSRLGPPTRPMGSARFHSDHCDAVSCHAGGAARRLFFRTQ